MSMRCVWSAIVMSAVTFAAAGADTADDPVESELVTLTRPVRSGAVVNEATQRAAVFSTIVTQPGRPWIRLRFSEITLGVEPVGGQATLLRLTSLEDGAVQTMNAEHLRQWRHTSAYFNGDSVLVEIIADPGAEASALEITDLWAGRDMGEPVASICGPTDDRVPHYDPRAARIFPGRCTIFIIDDPNHCILTAGHCESWIRSSGVVEFNVPLSDSFGNPQHPGPEDQYAYDPASLQGNGGQGVGDDWAVFGCFANTNTGLTPFEAQCDYYRLADTPPPVQGQDIRITGYGVTSPPIPDEWNRAEKTHVGPYDTFTGTTVRYRTDTTSGNSGSPVILEEPSPWDDPTLVIGIHTHGGCTSGGGANAGTGSNHAALQAALANPQGVCARTRHRVTPDSFAVGFGRHQSGGLDELAAPDNRYLEIAQWPAFTPLLPVMRITADGTSPASTASRMTVRAEAGATSLPSLPPQKLWLFDHDAAQWELADERDATREDSAVCLTSTADPGRFVDASGAVSMRLEWFNPGNVISPNWGARIDQMMWEVEP